MKVLIKNEKIVRLVLGKLMMKYQANYFKCLFYKELNIFVNDS